MKNISLVLNGILLVAVGVLYYLHFSSHEAPAAETIAASEGAHTVPVKPASIVFLNSDSLIHNYAFLKAKKDDLEARHKKVSADLEAEGLRLQKDAETYRQQGASMTDQQRMQTEEQLMMRQQQLLQKEKSMMAKLDDEQERINDDLFKNLSGYLKEYNKTRNYEFILGYQKGGGILLANDSLDITQQVLDGLNKKYAEETK